MNQEVLKKIGLTENEVKVYFSLMEMGATPAGDLIKKTELHRTAVYDLLERLIEKGLVTYILIGKIKHFEAVEPSHLLSYIEQKKDELDDYKREIEKLLPELNLKRKLSKESQEAAIFKGKKAIKAIAEDVLRAGKEMYVYGAEGKLKQFFPVYYSHFHMRRLKKKINIKIIYCEKVREQQRHQELKNIEIKYLPDEFETPANTWIYGEKVAIIVWSEQPVATLIRSKEVAKAYHTNFGLLWGLAKK